MTADTFATCFIIRVTFFYVINGYSVCNSLLVLDFEIANECVWIETFLHSSKISGHSKCAV
jgi:hypothetical protein